MRFLIVATVSIHLRAFHLPLVRTLRALGHEVHGAASGIAQCADCLAAFSFVHETPFTRKASDLVTTWKAAGVIRKLHQALHFAAVHVHTPIAGFATRLALKNFRRLGLRVFYTAHGFHFLREGRLAQNAVFLAMEKLAAPWTDALCVINHDDYNAALRNRFLPRERLVLIPGAGIDLERFRPPVGQSRLDIRKSLGFPADAKIAIMVAELSAVKRHRDAIDALANEQIQELHLVLCGTGAEEARLRQHVAALQMSHRVHFLGYRTDIPTLLAAADACLLVSEREGLPLSLLEAMAMKVPIVGTDVRGIRDLLQGGAGYLCACGDTAAIAESLARAISDPAERRAMTEAAERRVSDYSMEKVLSAYLAMYDRFVPGFAAQGKAHVTPARHSPHVG